MNQVNVNIKKVEQLKEDLTIQSTYYEALIYDDNVTIFTIGETMEEVLKMVDADNIIDTIATHGDEGSNEKLIETLRYRNNTYYLFGSEMIANVTEV